MVGGGVGLGGAELCSCGGEPMGGGLWLGCGSLICNLGAQLWAQGGRGWWLLSSAEGTDWFLWVTSVGEGCWVVLGVPPVLRGRKGGARPAHRGGKRDVWPAVCGDRWVLVMGWGLGARCWLNLGLCDCCDGRMGGKKCIFGCCDSKKTGRRQESRLTLDFLYKIDIPSCCLGHPNLCSLELEGTIAVHRGSLLWV